jgi:hypothetical protein
MSEQRTDVGLRVISTPADFNTAILLAEQFQAVGQIVLLRAARDRLCVYVPLLHETPVRAFKRSIALPAIKKTPAIALIGDDDGLDRGPGACRAARQAVRWAASIIVHASGAEAVHYAAAVMAAQIVRRVLIVECSSHTAAAWLELVQQTKGHPANLLIHPPDGGVHPAPTPPERLQ